MFPPRQVASGPCFVIPCITSKDAWKDVDFIEERQEELGRFLRDLLTRRGYCSHPIVVEFLELDGFVGDELSLMLFLDVSMARRSLYLGSQVW